MEDTHLRRVEMATVADPAPLGLAAFALTTFLLSVNNAGWTDGGAAWLGFAFAYGGLAQLLAGMWEFRNRNVFGATAFSTYGSFWIGLGLYVLLAEEASPNVANDLGFILLAFAIFNTYMLLWSTRVTVAVFLVFLTLEVTEIVLSVGFFIGLASPIDRGRRDRRRRDRGCRVVRLGRRRGERDGRASPGAGRWADVEGPRRADARAADAGSGVPARARCLAESVAGPFGHGGKRAGALADAPGGTSASTTEASTPGLPQVDRAKKYADRALMATKTTRRRLAYCYLDRLLGELSEARRASTCGFVVGAGGFEPPASCSQSRRATRLRYAP